MKTQAKNTQFAGLTAVVLFTTLMVFALVNSVKASNAENIVTESSLEIEPWMTSEVYWSMDEENENTDALVLENWMFNDSYWGM